MLSEAAGKLPPHQPSLASMGALLGGECGREVGRVWNRAGGGQFLGGGRVQICNTDGIVLPMVQTLCVSETSSITGLYVTPLSGEIRDWT